MSRKPHIRFPRKGGENLRPPATLAIGDIEVTQAARSLRACDPGVELRDDLLGPLHGMPMLDTLHSKGGGCLRHVGMILAGHHACREPWGFLVLVNLPPGAPFFYAAALRPARRGRAGWSSSMIRLRSSRPSRYNARAIKQTARQLRSMCPSAIRQSARRSTPCLSASNAYSAARLASQAEPIADQSGPNEVKETQSKLVPKEQSCWHPGLSRNIGIAEPSCDLFNSEPRVPPQSTRPCSGNKDQRRASC